MAGSVVRKLAAAPKSALNIGGKAGLTDEPTAQEQRSVSDRCWLGEPFESEIVGEQKEMPSE